MFKIICLIKQKTIKKTIQQLWFGYTAYLNFTTLVESTTVKDEDIKFKCLFCDLSLTASLGKTSNIKSHLEKEHRDNKGLMKWISSYDSMNEQDFD